jgi:hypothetical protein
MQAAVSAINSYTWSLVIGVKVLFSAAREGLITEPGV